LTSAGSGGRLNCCFDGPRRYRADAGSRHEQARRRTDLRGEEHLAIKLPDALDEGGSGLCENDNDISHQRRDLEFLGDDLGGSEPEPRARPASRAEAQ
jgi:hypothetical protein